MSKNTFNNIGKKHIIHFMNLPVVFFNAFLYFQLYVKGDFTPSQAQWSDTYHPQTPRENARAIYTDIVSSGQRNNCIWGETTPYNLSSYSYRCTPSQNFPALSPYYNPRATDSYLPSYDMVNHRGAYYFSSPLYSTSWSPPASCKC